MMRRFRMTAVAGLALAAAACDGDSMSSRFEPQGRRVFAVDASGNLLTFGTQNSETVRRVPVTGLRSGEVLLGIDFRPANGQLVGVGSSSRLYAVDTLSAVATPVGAAVLTPPLQGRDLGFDFNPVVDRIRVHGSSGLNYRIHPETGAVTADAVLSYAANDAAAGTAPQIAATAYTNSVAGATSTVLFAIDGSRDVLTRVDNPNGGVMATVGPLGVNTTLNAGFDIVGNEAYAAFTMNNQADLYTVNLTTGAATRVARIGIGVPIRAIAVAP